MSGIEQPERDASDALRASFAPETDADETQRAAPPGPGGADPAARAAELLRREQRHNLSRRNRVRRYAVAIPAALLIGATLWVIAAIVHYSSLW